MVIRSDPGRSLPTQPRFVQSLYGGLINVNFTMEPIHIQLTNGTYTPEVTFFLKGVDLQGFMLRDNENGSIDITWNPLSRNASNILKHKTWQMQLMAEHTHLAEAGETNLIVELADFQGNLNASEHLESLLIIS